MTDHEKRIREACDSPCTRVAVQPADLRALLADLDTVRAILALRPQAVPMTDEQRQQAFNKSWATSSDFFAGIEAAEAHHGITAQAKEVGL